ncbi:hypothetical protein [Spirosoma areae]
MSLRLLIVAGLLAHGCAAYCQTQSASFFLRRYVANVRQEGKVAQTGVLFDLTDSTILLAPIRDLKPTLMALLNQHSGTLPPSDSLALVLPLRTYRYSQISRLTLHRRGHGGKGFLIGAGLGIILVLSAGGGETGGYTTPAQNALAGVVLLGIPGLLVGAAMTKSVNAKEQSLAANVQRRFQKFTIVEQVRRHDLYRP